MNKTSTVLLVLVSLLMTACASNFPQDRTFSSRQEFEEAVDNLTVFGKAVSEEQKSAIKEASKKVAGGYINQTCKLLKLKGGLLDGLTKKYMPYYVSECGGTDFPKVCDKVAQDLIRAGDGQPGNPNHNEQRLALEVIGDGKWDDRSHGSQRRLLNNPDAQ